jgi:hypothetical protein
VRIYVSLDCESCDNPMRQLVVVLDEHRGVPVVDAGIAANTRFDCDYCGTVNWTGDLDVYAESPTDLDEKETGTGPPDRSREVTVSSTPPSCTW